MFAAVRVEGQNQHRVWTGGLEVQALLTGETRHDAPSRNMQQHNPLRKGTMIQPSAQEQQQLCVTVVQYLLKRQGSEVLSPYGHVHATRDAQEMP